MSFGRLKIFSTVLTLLIFSSTLVTASDKLHPQFAINGECYLLIGKGPNWMRGIYRLNNPLKKKSYMPPKYLFMPDSSIGFSVDLNRNIYTFSEEVEAGFTRLKTPLKRQVLDSGSTDHADYGYHQWIHCDHRPWGRNTDVYRTGPKGRGIRGSGNKIWPHFKSAGPGEPIPAPSGDVLLDATIPLPVYEGKNWYKIPNGAWFSSWRTKKASPRHGYKNFYVVYGDIVEGKAHEWTLFTYSPNDSKLDAPSYTKDQGNVVASSTEKRLTRRTLAGCLDGCGGASGSGSGEAEPMITDLAFVPPLKGEQARTYFYTRPVNKTSYNVTKNNEAYAPLSPFGNPLIGSPASKDTYWIGASVKDSSSDYVYTLGTSDIRTWYKQATGKSGDHININAIAISNQFNQKGGIVFAFDRSAQMIYKFIRYENDPGELPVSSAHYEGIDVSDLNSLIDAEENSQIDDIQADGFGSLFFVMSYPADNMLTYDPRKSFELNDAIKIFEDPIQNADEDKVSIWLIFCQEYGKAVFERSVYSSVPKEIGRMTYAKRYYNTNVRISSEGLTELNALSSLPNNNVEAILASWGAIIGDGNAVVDERDFAIGSLGLYYDYNHGDLGKAKLAVINVPAPPRPDSGTSWLDICGPYTDIPVSEDRHSTQQDQYLIRPVPDKLELNTVYYYMVENYPIPDSKWEREELVDWDQDGRRGSFKTSIVNKNSSTNAGDVRYRWRTWQVEDMYGNPVCPPKPYPTNAPPFSGNTGQENFTFFYSPVRGKFILTAQVIYSWYDYSLFTPAIGWDLRDKYPGIKRVDTRAVPVSLTGAAKEGVSSRLNEIMKMDEFKFMQASASIYINHISENGDELFACEPIVAGIETELVTKPENLIATIERFNCLSANVADEHINWAAAPRQVPDCPGMAGAHGLKAGDAYYWRINLASQSVMFDDISKSNASRNFIAEKMKFPEYNSDGKQINTLWVNHRNRVAFRGDGADSHDPEINDLMWMNDNIELESYLEYIVPDEDGSSKVVKLPLLASVTKAIDGNFPVIASTGANLPPTDPFFAELFIKMTRTISYSMWVQNKNKVDLFRIKGLPLRFSLYGRTRVLVIDNEKPKILYAHTRPVNLYGKAGFPLEAGVNDNPEYISFRMSDNNPWEAVDDVIGIEDINVFKKNYEHNKKLDENDLNAEFNYWPVFAKLINRKTRVAFDRAARIHDGKSDINGTVKIFAPSEKAPSNAIGNNKDFYDTFSDMYVHRFAVNHATGELKPVENRLQRSFQSAGEIDDNGNEAYFATIGFKVLLSSIRLNSRNPLSNALPKGYANNTPGYYYKDKDGNEKIRPYKFYFSATDSSGNSLNNKTLNIALHPKDVHKPNPYAWLKEYKNKITTYFPVRVGVDDYTSGTNTPFDKNSCTFKEDYFDDADWIPDTSGIIKIKTSINPSASYVPAYKSLPQLDEDKITFNYAEDPKCRSYYSTLVENLPPLPLDDNVEFDIGCGVSDNAGRAVATLTYFYLTKRFEPEKAQISSNWVSAMNKKGIEKANSASSTRVSKNLFRGRRDMFPMSVAVTIKAEDNAREWDSYIGKGGQLADPNNPWSDWIWGPFKKGKASSNKRIFKTSIPVFGTHLEIRTKEKKIRNK